MELILRAQAENPYFCPYMFQGLNDVIMSYKFTGIIILEGGRPRSERWPEGQKGVPHAAWYCSRVGPPILALVAPFASILLPEASS